MSCPIPSEDAAYAPADGAHALLESEERLRFAVEAGRMAIWEVELDNGKVTNTPELNAMFGFPPDATPSLAELRSRYAPGELEKVRRLGASWEVVRELVAKGQLTPRPLAGPVKDEDRTQVNAELTIIVPPNITKHLLYRAQYVYTPQGRPKITGFLIDMTEKRQAQDQLAMIASELRHRVKNSFTVAQALARQTFQQVADPEAALQSYLGRLRALALANDLVLSTESGAAQLRTIAERIAAPFRIGKPEVFVIDGPEVAIQEAAVTGMSMVLHELCTNALKYGALSQAGGQVSLSWTKAGERVIALDWIEHGGPTVVQPERQGFGTQLLTRMVEDSLSGSIDVTYGPSGVACRISTSAIALN